ncbi:MAG: FtsQ-type POTRA domain-containing protein [Clostridia bacterium]|nr:FtsQ-type POTRA domain-containing protein [Clostridia bacterium]
MKVQQQKNRSGERTDYNTGRTVGKLIIMAAVVAALIFGVAIFFKVSIIEVQGNSIYSTERILEASGLEVGDNLLTVNKATTAGSIKAALPYVESVSIARSLPDTVVIQVRESEACFAVSTGINTVWLINASGKALERIDASEMESHAQIIGVSIDSPSMGEQVTSPAQDQLNAALIVLKELDGTGILENVASVNVEKEYDIVLWYADRYEVRLGGTENMTYKIQYLVSILDQLSEYQAGVSDLTDASTGKARFQPRA